MEQLITNPSGLLVNYLYDKEILEEVIMENSSLKNDCKKSIKELL